VKYLMVAQHSYVRFALDIYISYRVIRCVDKFVKVGDVSAKHKKMQKICG